VLAHINFRGPIRCALFSPDEAYLAVTHRRRVEVWRTPAAPERQLAPLSLVHAFRGAAGDITTLEWHPSSRSVKKERVGERGRKGELLMTRSD